jgi:ribonuclease-3
MEKSDIFKKDPYNPKNKLITQNDIINIMKLLNINDFKINDIQYYQTAFIHKSYCKLSEYSDFKYPGAPCLQLQETSYETMEFLGDSILGSIIASYIYRRYYEIYKQNEGFLTKIKIRIVCGEALSKLSNCLNFNQYLIISKYQEDSCNGRNNSNILEDVFESFIGAMYLDTNYQTVETFLINVIEKHIDFTEILLTDNNYKDQISRYFQKAFNVYPKYQSIKNEGGDFTTYIFKDDEMIIEGFGKTKKKAEQDVSRKALIHFNVLT